MLNENQKRTLATLRENPDRMYFPNDCSLNMSGARIHANSIVELARMAPDDDEVVVKREYLEKLETPLRTLGDDELGSVEMWPGNGMIVLGVGNPNLNKRIRFVEELVDARDAYAEQNPPEPQKDPGERALDSLQGTYERGLSTREQMEILVAAGRVKPAAP